MSVAIPAAAVTLGLTLMMGRLIEVEFAEPAPKEIRELAAIIPQEQLSEPRRTPRAKPTPLPASTPPPPRPTVSSRKSDIDLPTIDISGQPPKEIDHGQMDEIVVPPIIIDDREAKPISPPVPDYPIRAAERGIEGSCEVQFNVNSRGEPFNVEANCTDGVFRRSAEAAVSRVRFAPKIVRGQATERRNVVYPLQFKIDQG